MYSLNPEFRISSEVVPNSLRFEDFAQTHLERIDPSEYGNIESAFSFAKSEHEGQFRNSGEPFFSHPLKCTEYYLEAGGRISTIVIATLLHDVLEDGFRFVATKGRKLTREANPDLVDNWKLDNSFMAESLLFKQFGPNTLVIIDTLTKIPAIDDSEKSKQAADRRYHNQLRIGPPEAWLIKGFDVLHNNRTLPPTDTERIKRKIAETRNVYVPIIQKAALKYRLVGSLLLSQVILDLNQLETGFREPTQTPKPSEIAIAP